MTSNPPGKLTGLSVLNELQADQMLADLSILPHLHGLKGLMVFQGRSFSDHLDHLQAEIAQIPHLHLEPSVEPAATSHLAGFTESYQRTREIIYRVLSTTLIFSGRVSAVHAKAVKLKAGFTVMFSIAAADIISGTPWARISSSEITALADQEFSILTDNSDLELAGFLEGIDIAKEILSGTLKRTEDAYAEGKAQFNVTLHGPNRGEVSSEGVALQDSMAMAPPVAKEGGIKPQKKIRDIISVPFAINILHPGKLDINGRKCRRNQSVLDLTEQANGGENRLYRFMGPDVPLLAIDLTGGARMVVAASTGAKESQDVQDSIEAEPTPSVPDVATPHSAVFPPGGPLEVFATSEPFVGSTSSAAKAVAPNPSSIEDEYEDMIAPPPSRTNYTPKFTENLLVLGKTVGAPGTPS